MEVDDQAQGDGEQTPSSGGSNAPKEQPTKSNDTPARQSASNVATQDHASELQTAGVITGFRKVSGSGPQNGYEGLEVLVQMESPSRVQLARMYDHLEEGDYIHGFVLTPREKPLQDDELDAQLYSVELQRKMAQDSDNVVRQLTRSDQVAQDAVGLRAELEQLKRDYMYQPDHWERKVQTLEEDQDFHARRGREDVLKRLTENAKNAEGIRTQLADA
ncbi:hypothetical protein PHYPSEUDO_012955 [Phytophthora pseudosyringae]|uniref:Uncharacterized protein n=1 Tax=Phytophthora pseudosyringae TaxID=221518 RepID=A0A8T1V8P7_9STRA|nr:hypothetical protein PHYPSEUDO_012955 [Phytophthora pseudosyringae]